MPSVLFSSARAVAMEKTLLGEDRLKRMIDGTAEDALKILSEIGFGTGENTRDEIDAVAEDERVKLCAFIRETAPDERLAKFFLYPYDFRNAESIIKSKYLKTEPVLFSGGLFDINLLKEKIFSDSYGSFPTPLGNALFEADKAFVDGKYSGQYINALFTKALYDELFALNIKDTRILKLLSAKADMINISVGLRTRDLALAEKQFVHLGKLTNQDLKCVCEDDFDKIRARFKFTEYKDVIFSALDGLENKIGLTDFEKQADGFAVKLIKKDRYNQDGAIPFVRYCLYKLADIENARIILVGHSANLSTAEISDRIREHYEG